MKLLLLSIALCIVPATTAKLSAQGLLPVVESGKQRSIIYEFDEDGYPLQEDGSRIEKKRFTIAKWDLVASEDASVSPVSAKIETPYLKIEETRHISPTRFSYNFRFQLSAPCRPFGVLIATNAKGKRSFSEYFILDAVEAGDEADWLGASFVIDESLDLADHNFECYHFEKGRQILLANDSPAEFIPVEPKADAQGNRNPSPVYLVLPNTPEGIVKRGKPTSAVIEAVIDEKGAVRRTKVYQAEHGNYGEQARIAVESMRFFPALRDGAPTSARIRLPLFHTP